MSRKKRKRSPLALIFTLAVMVLILGAAVVLYNRTSLNKTEMNKMDYYGLEKEDQAAVIVNDEILTDKGIVRDGKVYLPYSMVWGSLNSAFYWEEDTGSLLLTLPEGTSSWKPDDGSGAVLLEGQTPYISAECVKENSDIDMEILPDPWRVTARTKWSGLSVEKVTADTQVRYRGGPKAEILTYVKTGDLVVLLERAGDWYKVSTTDGYLGYIKDTYLEEADSGAISHTADSRFRFDRISLDHKINLSWQYVSSTDNNAEFSALTSNAAGLNTISPTWFSYADAEGNLNSLASPEYVQQAHAAGMDVWPALQDVYGGEFSSGELLKKQSVRQKIIDQLLQSASDNGFDGINIDIETVTEEQVPQYLQFLRELCVAAHKQNLVISVDEYVPDFTKYYNRAEQAKFCDYIVIMGYDEHTASSEEAGSVASLPFVEKGITDTLEEVPADQVINAIPFYCRGWTAYAGESGLNCEAFGMDQADKFVSEHNIALTWDSEAGQYTGSTSDENATYSIWMEEEKSVEAKMQLIRKYNLAGVASWRLGFERDDIWEIINKYLQ